MKLLGCLWERLRRKKFLAPSFNRSPSLGTEDLTQHDLPATTKEFPATFCMSPGSQKDWIAQLCLEASRRIANLALRGELLGHWRKAFSPLTYLTELEFLTTVDSSERPKWEQVAALIHAATEYLALKQPQAQPIAVKILRLIFEIPEAPLQAYYAGQLAALYNQIGNRDAACSLLNEIRIRSELLPRFLVPTFLTEMACAYAEIEQDSDVQLAIKSIPDLDDRTCALIRVAIIYSRKRDMYRFESALNKIDRSGAKRLPRYSEIIGAYLDFGFEEKAIQLFSEIIQQLHSIELSLPSVCALAELASVAVKVGSLADSRSLLAMAESKSSELTGRVRDSAFNCIAKARYLNGNWNNAINLLGKINYDDIRDAACYDLAEIAIGRGRYHDVLAVVNEKPGPDVKTSILVKLVLCLSADENRQHDQSTAFHGATSELQKIV